jgi:hypothetical protein
MGYIYGHTLFHGCERDLREATFYYREPNMRRKCLQRAYKGHLKMHAKRRPYKWALPLECPYSCIVCPPMSFETLHLKIPK